LHIDMTRQRQCGRCRFRKAAVRGIGFATRSLWPADSELGIAATAAPCADTVTCDRRRTRASRERRFAGRSAPGSLQLLRWGAQTRHLASGGPRNGLPLYKARGRSKVTHPIHFARQRPYPDLLAGCDSPISRTIRWEGPAGDLTTRRRPVRWHRRRLQEYLP